MQALGWLQADFPQILIPKIPLHFNYPTVQVITKQLTKLNSNHPYRISYLGPRWDNSNIFHKKFSAKEGSYPYKQSKVSKSSNGLYDNKVIYVQQSVLQKLVLLSGIRRNESDPQSLIGNYLLITILMWKFGLCSKNRYKLIRSFSKNRLKYERKYCLVLFFLEKSQLKSESQAQYRQSQKIGDSLFKRQGLNPYVYSSKKKNWSQQGVGNVSFQQKFLRYQFLYEKVKAEVFYQLSFEVQIDRDEEVKFAYCIPYSYSNLLTDLQDIKQKANISILGRTLTGIKIPIVMIGKIQPQIKKQIILITSRVHPSETNTSIIISKFMKNLCFDPSLQLLRQRTVFIIIPMVNPDGVILGNSRTGASGLDLNRQFKTKDKPVFPQVTSIKRMVSKIMQKYEIQLFLDLHGHSKKKNMFIYGPPYNITEPQYYKCRVFPKILSNITNLFRYYSCQFDIPYEKRATARAVMLNELSIPFVYTIESSLGFYYDYSTHKNCPFTRQKWQELGIIILQALKQYFQGLIQYQQYLQMKRINKKNMIEQLKSSKKNVKEKEKQYLNYGKQFKLLKIYEQIRQIQQKNAKNSRKQKDEENQDSDSYDQNQNLQKEKYYQFSGMVTDFIEQQKRIVRQRVSQSNPGSLKQLSDLTPTKNKKKHLQILRNRQKKLKEEQALINEQIQMQNLQKQKKQQLKSKKKHRKSQLSQQSGSIIVQRTKVSSQQLRRGKSLNNEKQKKEQIKPIPSQQFIEYCTDLSTLGEKKINTKMNIRMFNFEKSIANQKSIRYNEQKQISKVKELQIHKNKNLSELKKRFDEKRNLQQYLRKESPSSKPNHINIDYIQENDETERRQDSDNDPIIPKQDSRLQKSKFVFPSSFYRIKYQNHKKKLQNNKLKRRKYEDQDDKQSKEKCRVITLDMLQTNNSYLEQRQQGKKQKEGLFVRMNRFPLL